MAFGNSVKVKYYIPNDLNFPNMTESCSVVSLIHRHFNHRYYTVIFYLEYSNCHVIPRCLLWIKCLIYVRSGKIGCVTTHLSSNYWSAFDISTIRDISAVNAVKIYANCWVCHIAYNNWGYYQVKSLQPIWRTGACRWNLRVVDLQVTCSDFT